MSRKSAKSFLALLLCGLIMGGTAGCSAGSSGAGSTAAPGASAGSAAPVASEQASGAQTGKKLTVGLVIKVINPYFTVMIDGAKKEAEKLGVNLQVSAAKQQTATEEQIAIMQDMIAKKVDAIVLAPIDSQALIPVCKDAQDAGIKVINIDNRLDSASIQKQGLQPITYVGVNDEDSAYMAAKAIVEAMNGQGEVAIIEGVRGANNAMQRKAGAEKAFQEAPGIKVVASQTANWESEQALNVFTNILQAHPNIKGVFCANDVMSYGAIQAIQSAGKTGQIVVTSIDGEDTALNNIKEGKELATIYQNQDQQAEKALDLAVDLANGKTIDPEYIIKTTLKTKNDIK